MLQRKESYEQTWSPRSWRETTHGKGTEMEIDRDFCLVVVVIVVVLFNTQLTLVLSLLSQSANRLSTCVQLLCKSFFYNVMCWDDATFFKAAGKFEQNPCINLCMKFFKSALEDIRNASLVFWRTFSLGQKLLFFIIIICYKAGRVSVENDEGWGE